MISAECFLHCRFFAAVATPAAGATPAAVATRAPVAGTRTTSTNTSSASPSLSPYCVCFIFIVEALFKSNNKYPYNCLFPKGSRGCLAVGRDAASSLAFGLLLQTDIGSAVLQVAVALLPNGSLRHPAALRWLVTSVG